MTEAQEKKGRGIAISVVISLLCGAATMASTWGAVSQRVENLEDDARQQAAENKQLRDLLVEANTKLAVLSAQSADLIRRADRIEAKFDRERER